MLSGRPVIASAAGGAVELIQHGNTGWLCPPNDARKLAELITHCYHHPDRAATVAHQARLQASQQFNLDSMHCHIAQLLARIHPSPSPPA
jgi:glycosyltransferase involved in cell wall biosynthesis